jgi:hypothetical protein
MRADLIWAEKGGQTGKIAGKIESMCVPEPNGTRKAGIKTDFCELLEDYSVILKRRGKSK